MVLYDVPTQVKEIMELSPKQQAVELIKESERILIVTHDRPDGDALGSIAALSQVLANQGKTVAIVAGGSVPECYRFLPYVKGIKQQLPNNRDFVISVNMTGTKVEKVMYKKEGDNKLNIFLTPAKDSEISSESISYSSGNPSWQLIIVLDCSDLSRLGSIHEDNAEIFYSVPMINIDHHPGNDYFGKINLVDFTSTSTSELLVSLIESLGRDKNLIDEDIATCLLTGIMSDTGSFQNTNTTPKSFTVAAQLVAAGARQQEIVRNIYKTRTLSTLKLWGRVLAKLEEEKDLRFVWSAVNAQEIVEAGASSIETSGVIDELLKTAANVDFALLLSERDGKVHGSLRAAARGTDVAEIAAIFGGGGHAAAAAFDIDNINLGDSLPSVLFKIKQFQAKRLQDSANHAV